jgi:hypothetical protein
MEKLRVGDLVIATRNGGHDKDNLPVERPVAGRAYRIVGIYKMKYGYGCRLEGLDPHPYRGYFLFVNSTGAIGGWYFKKVEKADEGFTKLMQELYRRPVQERGESSRRLGGGRKEQG